MIAIQDSWIRDVRIALRDSDVDFFKIKPSVYWTDFFVSATVAYLAASVYLISPLFSWSQIIAFPFAIFWLYRLGSLVHEVSHLPQKEMRLFKTTWNLLVGVMTLAPSPFFTAHHRDHHTQRMYGSPQDPEYVINICRPGSWLSLLGYFALMVVFPALVFLRFLLAPLTFLHPKLRQFVLTRASSLTMNWRYERKRHTASVGNQNLDSHRIALLGTCDDDPRRRVAWCGFVDTDTTFVCFGGEYFVVQPNATTRRSPFSESWGKDKFRRTHPRFLQLHGKRSAHLALLSFRHSLSRAASPFPLASVSQFVGRTCLLTAATAGGIALSFVGSAGLVVRGQDNPPAGATA